MQIVQLEYVSMLIILTTKNPNAFSFTLQMYVICMCVITGYIHHAAKESIILPM